MRTNNVNDVELLLSKLSKQELCEFIREECAGDRLFRQRFIALGAGVIFHPGDFGAMAPRKAMIISE